MSAGDNSNRTIDGLNNQDTADLNITNRILVDGNAGSNQFLYAQNTGITQWHTLRPTDINTTLSKITNTQLQNDSITINGVEIDLGTSGTIPVGDTITATAPMEISVADDISLNFDTATLENASGSLKVKKVPNTLTITDSAGTSVVYDGDTAKSITINDNDTTYQGGTGITIDTSTNPDTINCDIIQGIVTITAGQGIITSSGVNSKSIKCHIDSNTIVFDSIGSPTDLMKVAKVPNTLTITDSAGTSVVYDGSSAKSITINDNDTTYQGSATINIDTSTNPDTISCLKVPNTLTITDSAGTSVVYDGSATKSITINDTDTTYQGSSTINIDTSTNPDTISCLKVPNQITFATDGSGSKTGTYDGSGTLTIDMRDTTASLVAGLGISITGASSNEINVKTDGSTIYFSGNNIAVAKVPNKLTAFNSNLVFGGSGTGYDGEFAKVIKLNEDITGQETITFSNASGTTTKITGNTYPQNETQCDHLDLTDDSNIIETYDGTKITDSSGGLSQIITKTYADYLTGQNISWTAKSTNYLVEYNAMAVSNNTNNHEISMRLVDNGGSEFSVGSNQGGFGTGTIQTSRKLYDGGGTTANSVVGTWYLTGLTIGNTYKVQIQVRTTSASTTLISLYTGGLFPPSALKLTMLETTSSGGGGGA
tara:strand:+ start:2229 stop:4196 length:1968 start_codon:yes stop_codon:yes gene_type:complete